MLLAAREFVKVYRPASRLIYPSTLVSLPLTTLLAAVILLRFTMLSLVR